MWTRRKSAENRTEIQKIRRRKQGQIQKTSHLKIVFILFSQSLQLMQARRLYESSHQMLRLHYSWSTDLKSGLHSSSRRLSSALVSESYSNSGLHSGKVFGIRACMNSSRQNIQKLDLKASCASASLYSHTADKPNFILVQIKAILIRSVSRENDRNRCQR